LVVWGFSILFIGKAKETHRNNCISYFLIRRKKMQNNNVEKELELTDEEHESLQQLLGKKVEEEAKQCYTGLEEIGCFEGTEIERLIDKALEDVCNARDELHATMYDATTTLPKTISVSGKQYRAILKERREKQEETIDAMSRDEAIGKMANAASIFINENQLLN
jgi:hypothetical protein